MSKFFLALENEGDQISTQPDPEQLLASTMEVEDAHRDMTDEGISIDELHASVDEGSEASDTLVEISGVMEAKIADGTGLSADAAQMAETAIESIRVRLGMPKKASIVPSLENFKEPKSRVAATKVALEGIKETAAKIWDAIIKFFNEIWTKIKLYIAGIFKNYKALTEYLTQLKAKAEALDGKPARNIVINKALANFFLVNPTLQVVNLDSIHKSLLMISEFGQVMDKVFQYLNGHVRIFEEVYSKSSVEEVEAVFKKAGEGFGDVLKNYGYFYVTTAADGKPGAIVESLPGNQIVEFYTGTWFGLNFKLVPGYTHKTDEIVVLSKEELVSILDYAINIAKNPVDVKKISEDTDKLLKLFIVEANRMKGRLSTLSDKFQHGLATAGLKKVITSVGKLGTKLPAIHFSTLRHVGKYASVCMAEYGEQTEVEA